MAYQQVTLTTLLDRLADRYESVPFWVEAEAIRALNDSLRVWNAMTGFWRRPFLTITVPDDPYVPLEGTIVQPATVRWNNLPLDPASLADFDYTLPNWRKVTTATSGAPTRPVYWARLSLTLIALYPADHAGRNALTVDGVRATPTLVDPTDYVNLGEEELGLLLGYAQHVLAFKVGGRTLTASYPQWLAFLQAGAQRSAAFAASAFYRKIMGLDQQRRLFRSRVPADTAVAGLVAMGLQAAQSGALDEGSTP